LHRSKQWTLTWLLKSLSRASMKRWMFTMNRSSNLPIVFNIKWMTTCWQCEHKEFAVTCEETIANAEEYPKLLKPPKKPNKTPNNTQIEKMCNFYHKPGHMKERCHWNPKNLNNKLKDKKKVQWMKFFLGEGEEWVETIRNRGTKIKEVP
jgi:hypothetical protein